MRFNLESKKCHLSKEVKCWSFGDIWKNKCCYFTVACPKVKSTFNVCKFHLEAKERLSWLQVVLCSVQIG